MKVNLCCFWELEAFSPFPHEMSLSIPDPLHPSQWLTRKQLGTPSQVGTVRRVWDTPAWETPA